MPTGVLTYEEQLNRDKLWALQEGGWFFERRGKVFESLRKIARKLDELQIPHAVIGALAFFHHGYRYFTEVVELLVTKDDWRTILEKLVGDGWVLPLANGRYLRDAETGVKILFFTTGEYPGDHKPKPITFPDPRNVAIGIGGLSIIELPRLIDLKLTVGLSLPHVCRDIVDVQEAIIHIPLGAEFGQKLLPCVREKYAELLAASTAPGLSDLMPE